MQPNKIVETIKTQVDLYDYVSRDVHLTRSGKNYRGHCPHPSHKDKNPSFVVGYNRSGQLVASCFGCGKINMDIINYVEWRDNVDFGEAISRLSREIGMEVEPPEEPDTHVLLNDVMSIARAQLAESQSGQAYLRVTRGLSEETIRKAHIGYVADGYKLIEQLRDKGYTWNDMKSIGLIAPPKNRCRFNNRILIPLWNNGVIQAIAGRQVGDETKYVRYLYTETDVPALYTLPLDDAHKPILLVEGLMDLLSVRTMGLTQSVALASASYARHSDLDRLKGYRWIYCLLHADDAGQRAVEILKDRYGDRLIPVELPLGYKDVNDSLVDGKTKQWLEALLREAFKLHQSSPQKVS